jgi:hypothetical protein
MIDVTGNEKTALNTCAESAIVDDCLPLFPRMRAPEATVAKFEAPTAVAALSRGKGWRSVKTQL